MVDRRPLQNEGGYAAALKAIEINFENEPVLGSLEADRFDLLAQWIGDYDATHWAIEFSRLNKPQLHHGTGAAWLLSLLSSQSFAALRNSAFTRVCQPEPDARK